MQRAPVRPPRSEGCVEPPRFHRSHMESGPQPQPSAPPEAPARQLVTHHAANPLREIPLPKCGCWVSNPMRQWIPCRPTGCDFQGPKGGNRGPDCRRQSRRLRLNTQPLMRSHHKILRCQSGSAITSAGRKTETASVAILQRPPPGQLYEAPLIPAGRSPAGSPHSDDPHPCRSCSSPPASSRPAPDWRRCSGSRRSAARSSSSRAPRSCGPSRR